MKRRLPTYPACPVCGDPQVNPHTLAVRWEWDEASTKVVGYFLPGPLHLGYENRVHGGILSALLDEAMAWACAARMHSYCVTGELSIRFKEAAPADGQLEISAWADGEAWGPYVRARGEVRGPGGTLLVQAQATFAAIPREQAVKLRSALSFTPGDFDVLAEE